MSLPTGHVNCCRDWTEWRVVNSELVELNGEHIEHAINRKKYLIWSDDTFRKMLLWVRDLWQRCTTTCLQFCCRWNFEFGTKSGGKYQIVIYPVKLLAHAEVRLSSIAQPIMMKNVIAENLLQALL